MKQLAIVVLLVWAAAVGATDQLPHQIISDAAASMAREIDGRQAYLSEHPEELYRVITDILLPHFDRRYAAYLVLNKHWKTATREQRTRFIDVFYASLLRNYAEGILDFDPTKIKVLPEEEIKGKRAVVETRMQMLDGTEISVNYSLRKGPEGWKVYDVRVDGVSYIRNYRNQFDAEIGAMGIDAVIARMEQDSAGEVTAAVQRDGGA